MVRSSLRITTHTTWENHITTEMMLDKVGFQNMAFYLDWKTLSSAGHVQRMNENWLPTIITNSTVMGKRRIGRPLKKHSAQVPTAMKRCGIETEGWETTALDSIYIYIYICTGL